MNIEVERPDLKGSNAGRSRGRAVDGALLRRLFRQMLRIRMFEERMAQLYPQQEIRCPMHLCVGQEAIAAGVCAALREQDQAFSTHRSHGHYLAKGGDMKALVAEMYGRQSGCCEGIGGSMHLVDLAAGFMGAVPILGSSIAIAVGAAFASSMKGEDTVTAVFFGDGAMEQGIVHESLNFAAVHHLPVIFVCENNLYSVYSPLEVRQPPHRQIFEIPRAHGIRSEQGDGNDVALVYSLARRAVAAARQGQGPCFLELLTYRWLEHCGPNLDNHLGYRSEQAFDAWKRRCPVDGLRRQLRRRRLLDSRLLEQMKATIAAEIEAAVAFARGSPFPDPGAILRHVYAGARPLLGQVT